ncbi:MAG: carboxypeptidase-like regulatory domain-containing protein, partial [Flavobacteriaceae bacterium]|nr:carboxypeptidase-like regulatory domain-containing protein [Flavobacteriaceae bacterium]
MKTSIQQNYLRTVLGILCFLFVSMGYSQTTISGKVTEPNGTPILGANVYLEGTYDGASSDIDGNFSFETSETGTQTLMVSFVSFETFTMVASVSELNNLTIKLREDVNSLDTVVISAGTFEASDNSKISVLKPLDVV